MPGVVYNEILFTGKVKPVGPILTVVPVGPQKCDLHVYCPFCSDKTVVVITMDEYVDYFLHEELAQYAFHNRSGDFRELVITGLCATHQI
jgi:hypothetical protein